MAIMRENRVLILGGNGLVGSALSNKFNGLEGYQVTAATRKDADLTNWTETDNLLNNSKPSIVLLAAAEVGGIQYNLENPALLSLRNHAIYSNVIRSALQNNVENLILFSSSSCYPRESVQPLREADVGSGYLEPSLYYFGTAKLSAMSMIEAIRKQYSKNYFTLISANVYGVNDNFNSKKSHALQAIVRKIYEAKQEGRVKVEFWGDGSPIREYIYADDLAEATFSTLVSNHNWDRINIGSGEFTSIRNLAELIASKLNFQGDLLWNSDFANGAPKRVFNSDRIRSLGWSPKENLDSGLEKLIDFFLASTENIEQ
jgi:GDP-L-fucose synthase